MSVSLSDFDPSIVHIECFVCGSTKDLGVCPIMTGDRFGCLPYKYPVCPFCIREWYDPTHAPVASSWAELREKSLAVQAEKANA